MTQLIWYPGHELLIRDIVRADNCHLYDSEGKKYLDLESGVWCTSIGHCNRRLLAVISGQGERLSHTGFNYSSGVVEEAAREVLSLFGFEGGKCVFLCSGSEAVEYGVRVAQSIAERPLMMTMADSYFGAYGSASRRERKEWFCFDWSGCERCPDSRECEDCADRWSEIPFEKIGGFLLEPGSSSGHVRFPPSKLIRNIAHTVKYNNGLIMVNEVTTGVGRTGTWFGYQHYGISPDIVAVGKGIGNGYPVSVTSFSSRAVKMLGKQEVKYAQSHQNDPLGAAVVREVIRVISEGRLIDRSRDIASVLVNGLEGIRERTDRIREIRSRGLMVAVELEDGPEFSLAVRTHRELARRGFIVCRRADAPVLRIDPALTIEQGDIEGFLEAFKEVLSGI